MEIIESINKVPIRLTTERWNHIVKRHPELNRQMDMVTQCIVSPDLIQNGDFGELIAIKYYKNTPLTSKYLVVVYKEIDHEDGFVITAYYTSRYSDRRTTIWKC
ncbi:MAG: hypothetical protein L7F77_01505 [Candidatus Magnetominusculus sp. LBB02]|nr:hypothetical protein [Candidatus Magnetominusculus sp. LBB02]